MRVGVIGAGRQGLRRAMAVSHADGDAMVWAADVDLQAALRVAAKVGARATTEWQDVVRDSSVEVVIVCTPPHLHRELVITALQAGKHVLCEKPMGRTAEDAELIRQAAEAVGRCLKCGFNLRFHPAIRMAHDLTRDGALGELMFLRGRYGIGGGDQYDRDWRMRPELGGGGQLIDQGIHLIDLGLWLMGRFQEGFAYLTSAYWKAAEVEDNAFVLLRTPDGRIASLHASWTQWRNLFSLEIFGTEGYAVVEGLGGSYGIEQLRVGRRAFGGPFAEECREFRSEENSWLEEWKEMRAAIAERRDPQGNGGDAVEAMRVVEALYIAAKRGQVVSL